ncbi:cytidine deaminase-like protein [Zychaea mexicana]|uniref:cytidine deaminase-like protein n=1 Tax=Zychaea mexicana TaxID=64656 RepID=UPI0022FECD9F|nr:cytidine deaminase-like protein [Zychaea mexicana]KAI9493439.1 cytidine deaminase-like protein [Zychaea mexicana]
MSLTQYTHDPRDREFMQLAIEKANESIPVEKAYCVGAVLVQNGQQLTSGFSREIPGNTHAEECALLKLKDIEEAKGGTMYTTMEPCSTRLSGNRPCTDRLIEAQIARVVMGVREPPNLVQCTGLQQLRDSGIEVFVVPDVEDACFAPNQHIIKH